MKPNTKSAVLLLAFSFFSGQAFSDSHATQGQPNIFVILADDLDYGELGCQGYTTQIPRRVLTALPGMEYGSPAAT